MSLIKMFFLVINPIHLHCTPVLLKLWSVGKKHWNFKNIEVQASSQILHFNKISSWSVCALKLEKHWPWTYVYLQIIYPMKNARLGPDSSHRLSLITLALKVSILLPILVSKFSTTNSFFLFVLLGNILILPFNF